MAHVADLPRIKRAQELNADRLFQYPNVVGVATGFQETREGFGTEEFRIQVFAQQKLPLSHLPEGAVVLREVPDPEGEGVRTDVIDAGIAQPLQDTTRYRPVPGGCSIGKLTRINAGTLGGWACDERDDTTVFLTNNHVVTATGNRGAVPANNGVALFDRSEESRELELTRPRLRRKEKQLRRLRSRIIEDQAFGEAAMQLVTTKTAQLSEVIHQDEIAFGLAVRAFGRLARKATNLGVLETELDEETIGHARRLARRVAEVEPQLEKKTGALSEALQGAQGKRVGDVLGVDLGGPQDRPNQDGPK